MYYSSAASLSSSNAARATIEPTNYVYPNLYLYSMCIYLSLFLLCVMRARDDSHIYNVPSRSFTTNFLQRRTLSIRVEEDFRPTSVRYNPLLRQELYSKQNKHNIDAIFTIIIDIYCNI